MLKKKIRIIFNGVDMKVYNPSNSKHKKAIEIKRKYNNKTVLLSILEDFRTLNYKERIIAAYYGADPGQKKLF